MISPELRFCDIDPEHWANLMHLLHPPPGGDPAPPSLSPLARLARATDAAPRSTTALSLEMPALVLHRGGRVLRIARLGGGTLPARELASVSADELRALRKRLGLPFVVAVDVDALPGLWADAQAAVPPDEDYVAQQLAMVRVLRQAVGQSVLVDPPLAGHLPLPSAALLQTTFDQLLPDDRSFVFYLVDGGRVWTSLIAAKAAGDLYLVTTHAAVASRARFSSIRADAPAVIRAVGERFDPVHIGLFLPLRAWHEAIAGDRSAIARALANRQAVLDPAPSWLMALVGAGAVAEVATRSARLAGRLLAASGLGARLMPGGAAAAEKLVQTMTNPLEALGLDPWDLLRWARDWARRLELEREVFRSGQ
jgi:hypothetical protein